MINTVHLRAKYDISLMTLTFNKFLDEVVKRHFSLVACSLNNAVPMSCDGKTF